MFNYNALTDCLSESVVESEKRIIALVGAGGKTSTMYSLGKFFAGKDERVILTTTTKVFEPSEDQVDELLYGNTLKLGMSKKGRVIFLGKYCNKNAKIIGFEPREAEQWNHNYFDILLYEADGAKGKPIKAPHKDEPLIIKGTTHVIGVIGLDALGAPVAEGTVHRVDKFCDITGCTKEETISVRHISNLVMSEDGLFKNAPKDAIKILLLTKMDDVTRAQYAKEIEEALLKWKGTILAI